MSRSAKSVAGATLAALLLLTGCTSGGSSTGAGATPGPSAPANAGSGGTTTTCVNGTWQLDTTDAANQMLQYLIAKGAPVTNSRADGPVELEIHGDGTMTYRTGVNYEFTADVSGIGMTITQAQTGESTGEWGWSGSSNSIMAFSGWTNNIAITNSVEIGGQAANFPIILPDGGPGSGPLTVTCAPHLLTTKADVSPFTLSWRR